MNERGNASRVDPSAVGLSEDVSLSAVRIFDHLTPRMQKVLFEAKMFKEQFHYQYCWSKGSFVYLRFAKMPRLEPSRLRISRTCTIYRTEVKAKYTCCCSVCQLF